MYFHGLVIKHFCGDHADAVECDNGAWYAKTTAMFLPPLRLPTGCLILLVHMVVLQQLLKCYMVCSTSFKDNPQSIL